VSRTEPAASPISTCRHERAGRSSRMRGQFVIEASPEAVAQRLARDLILSLHERLDQTGTAHLACQAAPARRALPIAGEDARYVRATGLNPPVDGRRALRARWRLRDSTRHDSVTLIDKCRFRLPGPSHAGRQADGDRRYQDDLRRSLADGCLDAAVLGMGLTGTPPAYFRTRPPSTSAKPGCAQRRRARAGARARA